jgi:prefoldin subunit 5
MKKIYTTPPLDEAIQTLKSAVDQLDEMIKTMQASQATLRSWLTPGKEIGWMEDAREQD